MAERPGDDSSRDTEASTSRADAAETTELQPATQHGGLAATIELPRLDPDYVPPAQKAPPRKKRRLRGWLIALLVIAVLIVVAWIVGDNLARDYAKSYIRTQIITTFDLPADQAMDIEIGPGSLIAQAIRGSIDSVDVDLADVPLGDIQGDVTLALTGIPLTATEPVDTLRVKLAVDEANVQNLSSYLSDEDNITIGLEPDQIMIGTTFSLLGTPFPVSVGLVPSAVDGGVSFDPTEFSVNDTTVSLSDLKDGPLGGLAGGLLDSQTYCIAEYLPAAIVLTDVSVTDDDLVLSASGDGVALGGPDMSTLGTCG